MAVMKRPLKSPVHNGQVGKKLPGPIARAKGKYPQSNTSGPVTRPRRFSLLYSSDSSMSEGSDVDVKGQQRRRSDRAKSISSNAGGKRSKLIRPFKRNSHSAEQAVSSGSESESESESDSGTKESENATTSNGMNMNEVESEDDDDDDDDDDDSDSESESDDTSSSEEDIDFVKLSAQRKKRSMKALSALKREGSNFSEDRDPKKLARERRQAGKKVLSPVKKPVTTVVAPFGKHPVNSPESSDSDEGSVIKEALDFKFRKDDDGIRFSRPGNENSEEDIGEEVQEHNKSADNDYSKSNSNNNNNNNNNNTIQSPMDDNLNQLHVPHFSDSEDSEYDIDQDAYFNAIGDEDDIADMDAGLAATEDEDVPVLREEENLMSVLQNQDEISFDGSVQESGSDPAEMLSASGPDRNNDDGDGSDEDDDEMMTVFDMPFYEDPKFASLYYCEDGSEPRLTLSTSLPRLISDEKMIRMKRREAKKVERRERIKRRKHLKERRSRLKKSKTKNLRPDLSNEEYMFGVFLQSDQDDGETGEEQQDLRRRLDFRSQLRRLGSAAGSDISSDDEYDNILLDIANMPSSDDSEDDTLKNEEAGREIGETQHEVNTGSASDSLELDLGDSDDEDDGDDDFQDESSVTNVFIDIDDLDPDSFYFHYSDDGSTSYSEMLSDDTDAEKGKKEEQKEDVLETVTYANDESTDEDDNLPPPSSRGKAIGSKAKEVVSANVVGLKPPKLGTWETDSKPFTIIDGLSTKSLYPLIQEHQHFLEQQQRAQSQTPEYLSSHEASAGNGDELTLNELLNMSELEDDDATAPSYSQAVSDWYQRPAVPLSAFRNKGVNSHEDDEYILPANSTRRVPIGYIGSERTRRKIDKVKELQRKKTEKKRKLKRRKKLLKMKREKQRIDKEHNMQNPEAAGQEKDEETLQLPDSEFMMSSPIDKPQGHVGALGNQNSRKNSVKSVGLAEIHEILGNDNSDLLENNLSIFDTQADGETAIEVTDAEILASLTAPIELGSLNRRPSWRRRQSMVEAAAENLRFTKNGLFSESALADIEGFINNNGVTSDAFEFSETLQ
ncbi:related to Protein IFH1 [Zygosaccharomyces bailii ISA1307]|nr:related to Protein IFH1 [Zygosaccharomyces bailii ISA1307]